MRRGQRIGRMVLAVMAATAVLGLAPAAYAQGCVLCYTTAAAAGAAARQSINVGILVLLIPALSLFAGVFFLLYRRAVSAS
jgi:hypothetical protein